MARMGEKEVRVRTRHENLKRASGSEVKGEGRSEVIKLKTTHKFVESQVAKAVVGQTIY